MEYVWTFVWLLHGIGGDKKVGVVQQCYLRPLQQQQEAELDEHHEGQLPYAADLQEDGAGQQRQQHTVAEILAQTGGTAAPLTTAHKHKCRSHVSYFPPRWTHLRKGAGGALAGADLQTALDRHIQTADQAGRHQGCRGVQLLSNALHQACGVTGKLSANRQTTGLTWLCW